MKARYLLLTLPLMLAVHSDANAAKKKKQTAHFSLIEAYNRPAPEVDQSRELPTTGDHFVIRWTDTNYPETFFWRGENGWMTCKIEKAHRAGKSGNFITQTDSGPAHKGDTLMITPVIGGKFPIPKEIPETAKNTLFYKTGGSAWLSFPVKKIVKK